MAVRNVVQGHDILRNNSGDSSACSLCSPAAASTIDTHQHSDDRGRQSNVAGLERITTGSLEIDFSAYRLLRAGKPVRLTRTEWALLAELARHQNQVLSHRTLLQRVWGTEYGSESDYVHTYISRLRRKLEDDPADPHYILTETGVGYLFQKNDSVPVVRVAAPGAAPVARMVNPLPLAVQPYYVGRDKEQAEIYRLLQERVPLISIYGRAGVGKTALACRVLTDPAVQALLDGMVLLSANSTGISLPRIVADFYRLMGLPLPGPDEKPEPRRQITELLEALNGGSYVLLLDNLEDCQDAAGTLTVPDLELFITMTLQQGGALRLLITGREPLTLPRPLKVRERVIMLEEGLSIADSVALLRRCDPDHSARLRDAPPQLLARLAEQTHGFPRALEAVAGLLLEDAFLTIDTLLADAALLSGEVNEVLVHSALARLDEDALRLMSLIAAFRLPVAPDVLGQIAAALMDTAPLRAMLNRLVKAFFLKYDAQTGRLTAHPIDRDYCYALLPADDSAFSRPAVHRQIAAYYRRCQSEALTSIEAMQPYQYEIEHLMAAGADDEAAAKALWLDAHYMTQHGFYTDLVAWYEALQGRVQDADLSRDVQRQLGEAYRSIGRVNEAVTCYERAWQLAVSAGDEADQAAALNCLGWAMYDLGRFERAPGYWEQARERFERLGDAAGTAAVYGGTGWVAYLRGEYDRAEAGFDSALAIFRRLEDARGRAINLGDLGMAQMAQGQYAAAVTALNEALALADREQLVREISYKAAYLATAYLLLERLDEADQTIRTSTQYREISVNWPAALALHGVILVRLNRLPAAREAFITAVQAADAVVALTPGLYHALYARALARAGLALLDHTPVQPAWDDYERAMTVCGAAGVRDASRRLLAALARSDPADHLQPLHDLLAQPGPP